MIKKFKVYYSQNNPDPEKAGNQYKPSGRNDMLVMNAEGIFFVFYGADYYPSLRKLSDMIGNYDVVWSGDQ